VQRGESIENPVTGERLVLRTTTADSGGELLAFDLFVRADGFLVGEHVHLGQEERFELVSGRMYLRVGREERVLGPGDTALVPPGVRHCWRNEGDQEFHAVIELRPALRAELLFELGCRLAREGKLNRRGIPKNPLLAAVIATEFEREIRGAGALGALIALLRPLAALGRLLGYRAIPDEVPPAVTA
jgi:mannose-6-phosphate isomerase-like protein (cupin superfamily)